MTTTRNQSKFNKLRQHGKSKLKKKDSNLKTKNGKCGICKGDLGDLDISVGSKFELSCVCCRRFLLIKKKCAEKLHTSAIRNKEVNEPRKSFTLMNFKHSNHKLHCKDCYENLCFYCDTKDHRGGKIRKVCDDCGKKWTFVLEYKENSRKATYKPCQKVDRGKGYCSDCKFKQQLQQKRKIPSNPTDKPKNIKNNNKITETNEGDISNASSKITTVKRKIDMIKILEPTKDIVKKNKLSENDKNISSDVFNNSNDDDKSL